jgi:hypothetical protein
MPVKDLLKLTPTVIKELATEFVRRGDECMKADQTSQVTACFLLALRSVSLLCGMEFLLKPNTRDSWDVLARSFMESRDLLIDFRFDDRGTRQKVHAWFQGNAWKAAHKRCEIFIKRVGGGDSELGRRWSMFSALSHPTVQAARNSAAMTVSRVSRREKIEDFNIIMEPKLADFLFSISTLIVVTTFDFPGWIPLGCDLSRMPNVEPFRLSVAQTVLLIRGRNKDASIPGDG